MYCPANNISLALSACRGESDNKLQSTIQRDHPVLRETVNDEYCDAGGQKVDLVHVGEMGGVRVFMAKGKCYLLSILHS